MMDARVRVTDCSKKTVFMFLSRTVALSKAFSVEYYLRKPYQCSKGKRGFSFSISALILLKINPLYCNDNRSFIVKEHSVEISISA